MCFKGLCAFTLGEISDTGAELLGLTPLGHDSCRTVWTIPVEFGEDDYTAVCWTSSLVRSVPSSFMCFSSAFLTHCARGQMSFLQCGFIFLYHCSVLHGSIFLKLNFPYIPWINPTYLDDVLILYTVIVN